MNDDNIIKTVRSYKDLVSFSYSQEGGIYKVEKDESTNTTDAIYILPGDGTVKNISSSTGSGLTPEQEEIINNLPSFLQRDLSFENLSYASLLNINYDVMRPNKAIVLSGNISINILNTVDGDNGVLSITRGIGGSETIVLGGYSYITFPTGANIKFLLAYTNQGGNIIWSL